MASANRYSFLTCCILRSKIHVLCILFLKMQALQNADPLQSKGKETAICKKDWLERKTVTPARGIINRKQKRPTRRGAM